MGKQAMILILLLAFIVGSYAYDTYCPTTPKTFEADYIKYCEKWMSSKAYCRDNAWPAFAKSFAFKEPAKVTEKLV